MKREMNKKNFVAILFTFLFANFTSAQIEQAIHPEGQKINEQSFETQFENFGKVEFASYADYQHSPPRLNLYLLQDGKVLYELPDYYGNKSWAFDDVVAVAFKDLNYDNLKDIIVMTNYITGMGPSGMEPFSVIDVYFQKKDGFKQYEDISEELNDPKNYKQLKTIKDVVITVRKMFELE